MLNTVLILTPLLLHELNHDLLLIISKELKSEFRIIANIENMRITNIYYKYVEDIKRVLIFLEESFIL